MGTGKNKGAVFDLWDLDWFLFWISFQHRTGEGKLRRRVPTTNGGDGRIPTGNRWDGGFEPGMVGVAKEGKKKQ
ncbi:hypothetical protein MtrunA17_Chr1g0193461 [Medicago truncatula]|uniref:Uncharacterized protein n=1 Tax=Medicago truncatula TaxID=3880 RepID=A0A396JRK1_MEDTR|nr:hypothetical protein MtrunA17_Chr1g0193461 [Medicago truncatula]